eukprot:g1372.t1
MTDAANVLSSPEEAFRKASGEFVELVKKSKDIRAARDGIEALLRRVAEAAKANPRGKWIDDEIQRGQLIKCMAKIVSESSQSIDVLCTVSEEKYDARDMIAWGRLRLASFTGISVLVTNEERSTSIMAHVFTPLIDMLRSASAKTDFVGVRLACNIVRNLILPQSNRPHIWKTGAFKIMLKHAGHKDPNTALAAAISVRHLAQNCEKHVAADAARLAGVAELVKEHCEKDPKHVHPIVRVELSRAFAYLLASSVRASNPESQSKKNTHMDTFTSELISSSVLDYIGFLLSSKSPALHTEALAALRGASLASSASAGRSHTEAEFKAFLEKVIVVGGISARGRIEQIRGESQREKPRAL